MIDWIPEALRHDPDDRRRCVSESHDGTDGVLTAREGAPPHVVAQKDHARGPRRFVRVDERTAEERSHARDAERGNGQLGHLELLRRGVAGHEISRAAAERAQFLDGP